METKPMSREELARELELLKSRFNTLKQAQVRIEREAMQLADAIRRTRRLRQHEAATHHENYNCRYVAAYTKAYLSKHPWCVDPYGQNNRGQRVPATIQWPVAAPLRAAK